MDPKDIGEIPDLPALQQLARALWYEGTARGAAVLVGAGFSKFADVAAPDTPEPPTWPEFARDMAQQLYPRDPKLAPTDPLRLAEEYRSYFGQAALDEFIRVHIRDVAWQPGALHRELLELEWSDVLTTNWDTLLERAADSGAYLRYEYVRSEADLAHGRAPGNPRKPRIVKLHGSIGTTEHFVVAEEDYRIYPKKFAAFVNFARQVFIENELCLLGFSGDDPNFLQWSGWVRDNLGGNARRIYLVGVLELGSAERKFLEGRNVAPIDLAPLVPDGTSRERHARAMHLFLDFLGRARPTPSHEWQPAQIDRYATFLPRTIEEQRRQLRDPTYSASILNAAAEIWRVDRQTYPGWLICPNSQRRMLRHTTSVCPISASAIDALQSNRRPDVLYEIAWRHVIALWPLDPELASKLAEIANPDGGFALNKSQSLEVVALLLRTARLANNDIAFEHWASVIDKHAEPQTNSRSEVAYQRALRARDGLYLSAVKALAEAMDGPDPIWLLRRAALLAEIGEIEEAGRLVSDSLTELERRQRSNHNSLWLRSRRAWAEWFARGVRRDQLIGFKDHPWPAEFRGANCDPEDEADQISDEVAAELREQQEERLSTVPLFEPGHYRDPSSTISFKSTAKQDAMIALDGLMEVVGLPMRLRYGSFFAKEALDSAELAYEPSIRWYVWFLRAQSDPLNRLFERYLGRIAIAQLPRQVASTLWEMAVKAISYWQGKAKRTTLGSDALFAIGRIRLWIEVLARLTVRQDPAQVRTSLEIGIRILEDSIGLHPWLYDPINHLVNYSIQATPPEERPSLVLAMLELPLPTDAGNVPFQWPEPIRSLHTTKPVRTSSDLQWDQVIGELLHAARPGSRQRSEAVRRLAYLVRYNLLTNSEAETFGRQLWGELDPNSGLPSNSPLLAFEYTVLPAPEGIDKEGIVRAYLFDCDIVQLIAPARPLGSVEISDCINHLAAMSGAAQVDVRPTNNQCLRLFDQIVAWRPPSTGELDPIGRQLLDHLYRVASNSIGEILRKVLVPSMPAEALTQDRLLALLAFIREAGVSGAVSSLPFFLSNTPALLAAVIESIHQAISGRSEDEVAAGGSAVETWAGMTLTSTNLALLPQLIEHVISSVESRREIGLLAMLHCVRTLIELARISENDKARVAAVLGSFLIEWDYQRIDPENSQAVVASLIRAECVRLAHALEDSGWSDASTRGWLQLETLDALPEVRFAMAVV